MAIRFDGRVAVVTGGGNGLGRDYCLRLAERGARVVVNDLGTSVAGEGASPAAADAVVAEIHAAGGEAIANYDSVAIRAGGTAIIAAAVEAFGRVDILINNAGVLANNRFEDLTDEQINIVTDVHLKAAFYVTQPAYRIMTRQRYGRILFTSSASGMFGHPWQANYGAAKLGTVGLMNVVSVEGRRHGVLANAILPAATTRLASAMPQEWMEVTNVSEALSDIDFGAIAAGLGPEQNTPLVLFLVSEACTATHCCYSALAGRYARVVLGAVDGWSAGLPGTAIPEDVHRHWDEINDRRTVHTAAHVFEEFLPAIERIKSASEAPTIAGR